MIGDSTALKPHSARTGRTVFSQHSAAVVRHNANVRPERGLSTILHGLQWYKLVRRTPRLSTATVQYQDILATLL